MRALELQYGVSYRDLPKTMHGPALAYSVTKVAASAVGGSVLIFAISLDTGAVIGAETFSYKGFRPRQLSVHPHRDHPWTSD